MSFNPVNPLLRRSSLLLGGRSGRASFATHASSSKFVTILECGARDGLQNESKVVPTEVKAELIRRLVSAGLKYVEAGAFVPPKLIPQMADTRKLLPLLPHGAGLNFPVLTPNVQVQLSGREQGTMLTATLHSRALDDIVNSRSLQYVQEVFVFGAASEGFSRANTNCTIAESLDRMALTTEKALALGLKVRGSVSCIVGSPFERGITDKKLVREMAKKMIDAGCYSVALGDTIGIGNPASIQAVVEEVSKDVDVAKLAIHCHDTYGGGVANVVAAAGIRTVDSSVGGLGGCPFAPGATGNVATEDILFALHGMGYETGVDLDALSDIGSWISAELGRSNASRAGNALVKSKARLAAMA